MRIFILIISLIFTMVSCKNNEPEATSLGQTNTHKIVVLKVLQTTNYTYLYGKENDTNTWLAVPKMNAKKGETYYYDGGMVMENFVSKELDRTFDKIYFLEGVRTTAEVPEQHISDATQHNMKPNIEKKEISLSRIDGGISIGDLYSDKTKYDGKTVKIKGVVLKINPDIMNRNWIHIQDGTDYQGEYDLTVTSQQVVKVGDTIVVEGKISLNKDFGAGYIYNIIMEGAIIK